MHLNKETAKSVKSCQVPWIKITIDVILSILVKLKAAIKTSWVMFLQVYKDLYVYGRLHLIVTSAGSFKILSIQSNLTTKNKVKNVNFISEKQITSYNCSLQFLLAIIFFSKKNFGKFSRTFYVFTNLDSKILPWIFMFFILI